VRAFETDIYKKDGSIITISINAKLYYDSTSKTLGIESVFRDVTQKKKLEEKERLSRERYRTLSEASFEAIFITDKGVFIEQNSQAEKMFGYKLSEAIGRMSTDWIVPEDREMVIKKILSEDKKPYEARGLRKDGSTFPAEVQVRMLSLKGRKVRITAIKDITKSKAAEKALIESEEKFRTLITNMEEIVYIINKNGKFLLSEGKGLSALGLKPGEVVGRSIYDLYKNYPIMLKKMELAFRGETVITEVEMGDLFFKSWFTPYTDQENEIIGLLGLSVDITEQKKAESKILEYQNRLKELAIELTVTEEKVRKRIAIDLHDDVGQILSSSRMQLATITSDMQQFEVDKKISIVSSALLKAIQATRAAIFNLSPPQLNEIGLYAAINDWMVEQIEMKYGIRTNITGINEKYPLDENMRLLLFRSIRELMINVVKHAKARNLRVDVKRNKKMLEISVHDDGIGFDYNNDISKLKGGSYGLFSVQERVSDMGGVFLVNSEPGRGTSVKIAIPFKE
jgi:PAS domain S-box-containing protein